MIDFITIDLGENYTPCVEDAKEILSLWCIDNNVDEKSIELDDAGRFLYNGETYQIVHEDTRYDIRYAVESKLANDIASSIENQFLGLSIYVMDGIYDYLIEGDYIDIDKYILGEYVDIYTSKDSYMDYYIYKLYNEI